jgi:solute carrier family 13 (sodium-dependent dicarboxylate transporter), member 2/3/5
MHQRPHPTRSAARSWTLTAGSFAIAALVVVLLANQTELPRQAQLMSGIFVLAALLWMTEALPLFATSLVVVGLQILLLSNPGGWPHLGFEGAESPPYQAILAAAVDPVVLLFFGGFLLARAAVKEGVDKAMASLILRPLGGSPAVVLLGIMGATALFSMWMSNTATAAMMMALVAPVAARLPADERFRTALLLAIPFGANLGGMGTPIGSPPNAVAAGFLRNAGHPVSFIEWMVVALPLMIALLLLVWAMLWRLYRPRTAGLRVMPPHEPMQRRGWYVVGVFVATVMLWLTEPLHGLPAAAVALVPAVAFTATRLLHRDDVNSLEWNVLILIAGGISLGAGMRMTGLDSAIVQLLLAQGLTSVLLLLAILVSMTMLLSTFISNTAAANLLLPIGISLGVALGGPEGAVEVEIAIAIALAASASMALPISTPPNAIAYAQGGIATRDLAFTGAIVGVTCALLLVFGTGFVVRLWGVGM